MYLGHFAVGLAAKPVAPKASLGILLVATQVLDILYPIFLLVGIAHPSVASPWDHGLVMSFVWSVIIFGIYFAASRDIRLAAWVGFLILSHWICDFISWNHVLPLAFSDAPRVGLGLYNSLPVMVGIDFGLFGIALAYYLLRTKAKDPLGKWLPWLLVAYLLALMPLTLLPGKLVIIMALGMVLVAPFGMWIDRHRSLIRTRMPAQTV